MASAPPAVRDCWSLKWPAGPHGELATSWIPLRDSSSSPSGRYNGQQRAHLILLITESWQKEERGQKRLRDLGYQ